MATTEKYLKPEVIQQVARLDLRARFIIEGFLAGLHTSPFHGFSVEFSEYRRYTPGDDPKDIDWRVYARTDRFYIKKFEAETSVTGYLMVDMSASMGYAYGAQMTKLDYAICLAAAMAYLMIHQHDPVGLVTFDTKVRRSLAPRSRRGQLVDILALLANAEPKERTDLAAALRQLAKLVGHRSLIILFSDLLADSDPIISGLHQLRHGGHDVIIFHILDEAEARFPFKGPTLFEDTEDHAELVVDADGVRASYLEALGEFMDNYKQTCLRAGIDYVPVDTSVPFDRALLSYLMSRRARF